MLVKILKTKNAQPFWYIHHIGEYVDVNEEVVERDFDDKGLFVIHTTKLSEYGNKKYIYVDDTDYHKQIRKQKLEKLENIL